MNIQKLFKPYFVKRKNGQCQVLIPLIELDDLCDKITRAVRYPPCSCWRCLGLKEDPYADDTEGP